jgi:glycosyltransferase involved in cell wall biosynthesis
MADLPLRILKNQKVMSFIIFGDLFTFPDGQAATNRVYTYAKGFTENGIKVHVVVFSSTYNEVHNGRADGVSYYHPFEQKKRSTSFLIRSCQKIKKHIRTYRLLKKINREDKIIAINSWTNLLSTHLMAWLLSKLLRTKLITECSEHPLKDYQGGTITGIKGTVKFYIESRLCDGILCISRFLVDFHKKNGVNQRKLFLIPSTVDPSRFLRTGEKPIQEPYVGYFGSLTFTRDSVDVLVKSFAQISKHHPKVRLVLGGFCTDEVRKQLFDLIETLNITEKVKLVEYLTRQEILRYIIHADVLVMSRSRDLESDASYPSKLTEFLATGKPVLSVNVGEIADFLIDNENAFLVEPGNPEAMADKLNHIFNNYEFALQAGQKGKELTATVFNYNYQSKRMIDFIGLLANNKS